MIVSELRYYHLFRYPPNYRSNINLRQTSEYDYEFSPTSLDVYSISQSEFLLEQEISKILQQFLQGLLIFDLSDPHWRFYRANNDFNSLDKHVFAQESSKLSLMVISKAAIYHHGSDLYTELDLKVKEDANQQQVELLQSLGFSKQVQNLRYFTKLPMKALESILQMNSIEIFEGKSKESLQREYSFHSQLEFYRLLASWTCIDNVNESIQTVAIRSRLRIVSLLARVSGYNVRVEIYEEKNANIKIIVSGVLGKISGHEQLQIFEVDRAVTSHLISFCDEHVERDKLAYFNATTAGFIFADRLCIEPSVGWSSFLNHCNLSSNILKYPPKLKLRKRFGPGRLVGKQLVNLKDLFFCENRSDEFSSVSNEKNKFLILMSVYEINNENAVHDLRISCYHFYNGNTVEYRISALERMMLFQDLEPIIPQVIRRLKLVFCNIRYQNERVLMLLKEATGFIEKSMLKTFSDEYEEDDYEIQSTVGSQVSENDGVPLESSLNLEGTQSSVLKSSSFHQQPSQVDLDWGWAIYFDRSPLHQMRGNLMVSIVLNTLKNGFIITVFDKNTFHESYRFLHFSECISVLRFQSIQELEELLRQLDEVIAYDLIKRVLDAVIVTRIEKVGLVVSLNSNTGEGAQTGIVLARLKDTSMRVLSRKYESQVAFKLSIEILRVKDLMHSGLFGSR